MLPSEHSPALILLSSPMKIFSSFCLITSVSCAIKVAYRVQIWKKTFCQNSDCFGYRFIKNDIMFMHLLCIYKNHTILSLSKNDTLNLAMYIITILTCLLNTYVVRLHDLISMNIFFTIKISQAILKIS